MPPKSKGKSANKEAKKAKKRKSKKTKVPPKEVDILSPAAMLNAYYISHNAADCLKFRGYQWPGKGTKKGKKRRR
ncbi:small lysine-rich protein 1 [Callorhinchus milii]|uniref:small lysine-rich protein 1 n=1 Tax=Callorhinchus milii TaxID=7868 RepID=UPI001C3F6A2B|nr:small lysine-rich protein 1 [Callorhinchus milii]XP_042191647.1 small lysine-rich protein 1 [Callorhinchus milii]